jgi:hypothetical protein
MPGTCRVWLILLLVLSGCRAEPQPGWQQGTPHPGAWEPTRPYRAERFSIAYPATAVAQAQQTPSGPQLVISELPGCRWSCPLVVRTWRDSTGIGLIGLVKGLTAPPAAADSDAGCSDRAVLLDTLPTGGYTSARLRLSCCDCASEAIYTEHAGWLAEIEYSIDDREPAFSPSLGRLQVLARSFRWRER